MKDDYIKKLKVGKDFSKKYKDGSIKTSPLLNYPEFRNLSFNTFNYMFSTRIKELTELWGKHDFSFRGDSMLYGWVVEFNGCEVLIFSGKVKGTTPELILNDKKGSVEDFIEAYKILMEFLNSDEEKTEERLKFYSITKKYNL